MSYSGIPVLVRCILAASAVGCGGGERVTQPPTVVNLPQVDAGAPAAPGTSAAPAEAAPDDPRACLGKCTGHAPPDLGVALQRRAADARRCHNVALRSEPSLEGASRVGVRIGQDGTVCTLGMLASSMPPEMNECVPAMFQQGTYPAPEGGCIEATVPMGFRRMP